MLPRRSWVAAAVLSACASTTFKPEVTATGAYRLQCASTLAQCMQRARKWCGDEELQVEQKSDEEVYGTPGHQTGSGGAMVLFRCGRESPAWKLPARSADPPPAPPPPPPARACVPGATQKCVGPGACAGGQACLADGSGFGPCDCGTVDAGAPDAVGSGL